MALFVPSLPSLVVGLLSSRHKREPHSFAYYILALPADMPCSVTFPASVEPHYSAPFSILWSDYYYDCHSLLLLLPHYCHYAHWGAFYRKIHSYIEPIWQQSLPCRSYYYRHHWPLLLLLQDPGKVCAKKRLWMAREQNRRKTESCKFAGVNSAMPSLIELICRRFRNEPIQFACRER